MARDAIAIKNDVIAALETIEDPAKGKSIMDALMVEEVEVEGGELTIEVVFDDDRPKDERWDIEDAIYDAVEEIDGVVDVNVMGMTQTAVEEGVEQAAQQFTPPAGGGQPTPPGQPGQQGPGGGPPGGGPQGGPQSGGMGPAQEIAGVEKVLAVASGKGGVGKSTVAVNLALGLKNVGYRVGLLDVDVYGPSLPTLLGVKGRPAVKERRIVPLEAEGLKIMSLGFLMDEDTPVIWRGPIVSGIIRQFLQDVDWSGLDYLIIDLPPGTGDAQLSLAQSVPLDGGIIVTTPSDLSLIDAARGLQMFRTLKVDVIGIVENMSYFEWPGSSAMKETIGELRNKGADRETIDKLESVLEEHKKTYIFGKGGGEKEAKRLGVDFLGEIPLDPDVRKGGDEGRPVVAAHPSSPVTAAFLELARRVADREPVEGGGEESEGEKKKRKGLFSFLKG